MKKGNDALVEIVIDIWQEKRLNELHNCPDCSRWLDLNGGWQIIDHTLGLRKKNKVQCLHCKKTVTVVLAGIWVELWEKRWGWGEYETN